jgi:CheY-like chemotaxis protein
MKSLYQPYRNDAFERWDSLNFVVVDDDPCVRDVLVRQLIMDGHFVAAVPNASAALQKLSERNFDILVTDQNLPGMSGKELAAAVKNKWPAVAVILLTGFGLEQLPFCSNVDVVLSKPISRNELDNAVARAQEAVLSAVEVC